ncbi:hypothetical protein OIU77_000143 [Salix suchowensis]|uniref:Uncharacterized protein n=1 Tax=Salix suchowensis TaxID=1278906 RepID=A0ABQ9B5C5_9ROSI|nr:hypothetical protein OIU77_000143 [Salix suchowensis]
MLKLSAYVIRMPCISWLALSRISEVKLVCTLVCNEFSCVELIQ